jgi:hypothetical protein
VGDIRRERRRDAQAEKPSRIAGTGVLRRADSSITIVTRPKGSDLLFDHPYNADYLLYLGG